MKGLGLVCNPRDRLARNVVEKAIYWQCQTNKLIHSAKSSMFAPRQEVGLQHHYISRLMRVSISK